MKNKLIGVVMCGGQSLRMGTDKGLLVKNNLTWVEIAIDKIKSFDMVENVLISINESQLENYQKIISIDHLIKDNLNLKGPLAGLLSVHHQFRDTNIIILACDMIDINTDTISKLISYFYANIAQVEAVVYQKQGEFEPLLGIYSSIGLHKIWDLYIQGHLQNHSMKHILETLNTMALPIKEYNIEEFKNYNFKENLIK